MPILKFAAIGECMIELRPDQQPRLLRLNFAGDTLNVALYLARYQDQANLQVHYVSAIGVDSYSNMMLEFWQQESIETHLVQRFSNHLPGIYLIHTDPSGERSFYYYRSESAARQLFYSPNIDKVCAELTQMDYLFISGITLAILDEFSRAKLISVLKRARQNGACICFDTNYRPKLWSSVEVARQAVEEVLQHVDIALPTFVDEQELFSDATPEQCIQRLQKYGVKEIVLKLGTEGSKVVSREGIQNVSAIPAERVIDTTAAGDSFAAAYLAARIKGLTPDFAAICGHKLAATVVAHAGAIIPKSAMPILFE